MQLVLLNCAMSVSILQQYKMTEDQIISQLKDLHSVFMEKEKGKGPKKIKEAAIADESQQNKLIYKLFSSKLFDVGGGAAGDGSEAGNQQSSQLMTFGGIRRHCQVHSVQHLLCQVLLD